MSEQLTQFGVENVELTQPMFRHKKRGSTYQVIRFAELQAAGPVADGANMVIYIGDDGKLWVREESEFLDGRFERLATTPARNTSQIGEGR